MATYKVNLIVKDLIDGDAKDLESNLGSSLSEEDYEVIELTIEKVDKESSPEKPLDKPLA